MLNKCPKPLYACNDLEQSGGVNDVHSNSRYGRRKVMVLIRWQSEEAWKNWEKSDVHIKGHREKRGQEKPE
ncbi:antibiotic biosynthesis monooxygenase family protein [Paenibacillus pabuli]|uniref:antibiotic biosynthesis monooxygenase family protein n=1 Tax=Paenibacillus pabuli TaxID=1472 RepID=UPI001FFF3C7F|nr:antibiotic biosynthesis monooxygenase [Paenibacillus pabuli]UPK46807.1 antibiotic biosynthesis monooxygenase [Paenibacillus pabuli]